MHGDLCKHLGIDSSTDHADADRYSNLFLNAYINVPKNLDRTIPFMSVTLKNIQTESQKYIIFFFN